MDKELSLDEITNFREVSMGRIASGVLYRSSHPLNSGKLGAIIERKAKAAKIACVLNLGDNENSAEILPMIETRSWYRELYHSGNILLLDMDFNFAEDDCNRKLKKAVEFMLSHRGPYLIHCFAGLDRTGFLSAVLEALMGAALDEIYADYLSSCGKGFCSFFSYGYGDENQLHIKDQLIKMNKEREITDDTIQAAAERYLLEDVGLPAESLAGLKKILGQRHPRRKSP
ncbi:MAG: tyrosine-protein phosphatase [Spirochaetales bacterium]|jgi:hypothetical protein|nr:tyrosine-protein phosphatase [Spirochaetales bacterium]